MSNTHILSNNTIKYLEFRSLTRFYIYIKTYIFISICAQIALMRTERALVRPTEFAVNIS